tara:strand:+ start:9 stop:458 length:450 start_codon:yes stop_codon:yes gene_type:complete
MTDIEMTGKECGLIKHLGRRNYQLSNEIDAHKKAVNIAMLMIYKTTPAMRTGEHMVLEYLRLTDTWLNAYVLTTIDEYENKKGVVSMVHYNQNGKYVGSVKKLGDTPIYQLCMTRITSDNYHLWSVVKTGDSYNDDENVFVEPVEQTTR